MRPSGPPLVYAHTVEGLFYRSLRGKVPSNLKAALLKLGFDLDKPPRDLPHETWLKVLSTTVEALFPSVSIDEGYYQLADTAMQGYEYTIMGKALLGMMRVLGPLRTIRRTTASMRSANNYSDSKLTELAPNRHELWINECNGNPHYFRALFVFVLTRAGAKNLSLTVKSYDGHTATYDVRWD